MTYLEYSGRSERLNASVRSNIMWISIIMTDPRGHLESGTRTRFPEIKIRKKKKKNPIIYTHFECRNPKWFYTLTANSIGFGPRDRLCFQVMETGVRFVLGWALFNFVLLLRFREMWKPYNPWARDIQYLT